MLKKDFTLLLLISLLFAACAEEGNKAEASKASTNTTANPDSIQIAESLNTFYKWYGETGNQLKTKFPFINTTGKHPVLDEAMLKQYFAEFLKSGVVSSALIEDEIKFYRACAVLWQTQKKGDRYSGLDFDRFYCQNDVDAAEFLTAGVRFRARGEMAKVQLMLKELGPNTGAREFEMKRENGKWLLSKLRCNSGVQY